MFDRLGDLNGIATDSIEIFDEKQEGYNSETRTDKDSKKYNSKSEEGKLSNYNSNERIISIFNDESNFDANDVQFLDETEAEYEVINNLLNAIDFSTQAINRLQIRANNQTVQVQQQQILIELNKIINNAMSIAQTMKKKLYESKKKNIKYSEENPHSTLAQWRINRNNSMSIKFQNAMLEFNEASKDFHRSLREKISRQAKLINENITEEQIDAIVKSNGDPAVFMQQALFIPDAVIDCVANIEEKHDGILSIERGVQELQELWNQLGILIDAQQEDLDCIQMNVDQTLDYVQKGTKHLEKAKQYQINARKVFACVQCTVCTYCHSFNIYLSVYTGISLLILLCRYYFCNPVCISHHVIQEIIVK